MDAQTTGNRIAENRKRKGLTQKELAERLHVSAAAVSKWERGLNYPDLALMEPLAEALEMKAAYLLGLEDEPTEQVIRGVMQMSAQEATKRRSKLHAAALLCAACAGMMALILPLTLVVGEDALFVWLYDLGVLNLIALTLGFTAWTLAGCGLFRERGVRLVHVCISLACCALALYIPTLIVDMEMRFGYCATVEDTIVGYNFGALVLMLGTGILNAAGWRRNKKT